MRSVVLPQRRGVVKDQRRPTSFHGIPDMSGVLAYAAIVPSSLDGFSCQSDKAGVQNFMGWFWTILFFHNMHAAIFVSATWIKLTSNYLKYKRVVVFFNNVVLQTKSCNAVTALISNHFTCDLLSDIESLVK